jgi:hypothetical protein
VPILLDTSHSPSFCYCYILRLLVGIQADGARRDRDPETVRLTSERWSMASSFLWSLSTLSPCAMSVVW